MDEPPTAPIAELMQHRRWVRALAQQLLRDESQVDDIEQQTWLAVLQRPPQQQQRGLAWLSAVVRNLASKMRRGEARRGERHSRAAHSAPVSSPATIDVVEQAERHAELVHAVRALREPYRTTLLLRYFEGLPPRQIARRMGVPVETVQTRTRRGREQVRQMLEQKHGGREAWRSAWLPLLGAGRSDSTTFGTYTASGALASGALLMSIQIKIVAALLLLAGLLWAWNPFAADRPVPAPRGQVVASSRSGESGAQGAQGGPCAPGAPGGTVAEAREAIPDAGTKSAAGAQVAALDGDEVVLRFVTDDTAAAITRDEIEQRQARAGQAIAAQWIREDRLDRFQPFREGHEDVEAARSADLRWAPVDLLHVAGEPAEGRWYLLLVPPLSPQVLLEVPPRAGQGPAPREIVVTLPRSPSVQRVRFVRREDGEAIAGASVTPYCEHGDDAAFLAGAPRRTDGRGELSIPYWTKRPPHTRPVQWLLETATHLGAVTAIEFRPHPEVHVAPIERKGRVRGKAYRPDGRPAAGALVLVGRKACHRRVEVGEDGSFELDGVLAGDDVNALLFAAGSDLRMPMQLRERVRVTPGAVTELDFGSPQETAHGKASLHGRITAGARPLAGLLVVATGADGKRKQYARTDANGGYEIERVEPRRVRLTIYLGDAEVSDDFAIRSGDRSVVVRAGERVRHDFSLPTGVVCVTVTGSRGEPLSGVAVSGGPQERDIGKEMFDDFHYTMGWSGKTGADGKVLLQGLLPGTPMRIAAALRRPRWQAERKDVLPGTVEKPAEVAIQKRQVR